MENFDQKIKDKLASVSAEETPSEASVNRMMQALDEVLPVAADVKSRPVAETKNLSLWYSLKVAASISVAMLLSYLVYSSYTVNIVVSKRAHEAVQLPDGSSVQLNSESVLTYNRLYWYFSRNVRLKGEAFFQVQKGSTFEVRSDLGVTKVLGTSFNVYYRGIKYEVSCFTGKVSVLNGTTGKEVQLTPGKGVTWQNDTDVSFDFDTANLSDWRNGEFHFDDARFADVIEEFERQFDVYVNYQKSLGREGYTGYFDNRNFDEALKLICDPLGLTYEENGNIINISQQKTD